MKGAALLVCVTALCGRAWAGLDMDHINPTPSLYSTPGFAVQQIFTDYLDFSGTVLDDFRPSGDRIDHVATAFEISGPNWANWGSKGWQVSVWATVEDAAQSGDYLNQRTVAQTFVPEDKATYTELFGTGANGRAFRVDMDVDLAVSPGALFWFGIADLQAFTDNYQVFILSNTNPALLGSGTADNSVGINPGNGFGLGTSIPVHTNAAYSVHTVPEPDLLPMALGGVGVSLLGKRRRRARGSDQRSTPGGSGAGRSGSGTSRCLSDALTNRAKS